MRALIVAALLGVTSAADAYCKVNELGYKTTDCTGDATTTVPSEKMGEVVGECKKDPATGVKGGKLKACSSTSYEIDFYSTEDCTGTAMSNVVMKIDGKCTANADGKTSYKVEWVPKAEGAKAVAAAWALVATAMVMTQV